MGMEAEKASTSLEEQSPDRETFEFVEKTAGIIFDASAQHFDSIKAIIEQQTDPDEDGEADTVDLLEEAGVSRTLSPYVHTYTLLIMARDNAELLIKEAERSGRSHGAIIDQLETMGFDRDTAITIFRVAHYNATGELSYYADHRKIGWKHVLRATVMFVIAGIAYYGDAEAFIFYIPLTLGLLMTGLAFYRFINAARMP